jgi:hypothetical protein
MSYLTEVREYLDAEGNSTYAKWFDLLNVAAAIKVTTAVHRMEQGDFFVIPYHSLTSGMKFCTSITELFRSLPARCK